MVADIHMRTDAVNLESTAHLPAQQETVHVVHMLRSEARSGDVKDFAI